MKQKAIEENIILFQNDALVVRSVSFAQTIFQKVKRFAGNDPSDIKAILSHLMTIGDLQHVTPDAVLEYLNNNVPEDQRELQAKGMLFKQRLAEVLSNQ